MTTLWESLTPRERQIVRLLAKDKRKQQVAKELGIASGTMEWYMRDIRDRTGLVTDAALIRLMRVEELS